MKPFLSAAFFIAFTVAASPAPADTTFNFLAAPEFGRGLGAGLEIGKEDRLVLGIGAGFGAGYSSIEGFVGYVEPGVAAGYRRYLGNWYLGPSLGVSYRSLSTRSRDERPSASALLDFGYRFGWENDPKWNTKLGLGGGAQWWPGHDPSPALGLTISIGFDL